MALIALLLIVEGVSTGLWIARLVPRLSAFSTLVVALVVARGLVGAMQLTGGVFLMGRRPAAVTLSQWALVASATLTTFEIGERLVPSNLVASYRWPLVGAYWVYAIWAGLFLRPPTEREVSPIQSVQVEKGWESEKVQAVQEVQETQEVQDDKTRDVQATEPGSTG